MNIELQVIGSALRAVAEEMGAALVRSAFSANIKERRDCSTALFDSDGRMIAQAEHIPVHLGAMPDAVAAVMAHDPGADDVWILNDPFTGGTHLPDITLVSRTVLGFAATRAHHADVGGSEPGSLPAGSTTLADEGVVIPRPASTTMCLPDSSPGCATPRSAGGTSEPSSPRTTWPRGASPSSAPAAGANASRPRWVSLRLLGTARARSDRARYLTDASRPATCSRPRGRFRAARNRHDRRRGDRDRLRGHSRLSTRGISTARSQSRARPPTSSSAASPIPMSPPRAAPSLPSRSGHPRARSLNARPPAAVAAGNVETSCRIADLLFACFAQAVPVPAQGQGTMNNVTFGNDRFTYYETIGGGQGACLEADGPSGVHVTMSNTLSTPTEALELAYPLRIRRHALRLGSGGDGTHRGGDGVIREIEALEPCHFSVVSERRRHSPEGVEGGGPGQPGRNLLNGEERSGKISGDLARGDVLTVETPGGGGHGRHSQP